jgi:osmotically-inducible protein OsmY
MKKLLQMLAFVLAFSTGIALAQAGAGGGSGAANSGGSMGANSANSGGNPTGGRTMDSASQNPSSASDQDNKNIKAHPDAVDDQTLHSQIHEQLATNPDLQGVQVEVNNGVATLSGSVPNKEDKKQAAKLVKSVAGVKKVKDNLSIGGNANGSAASSSMGSQSGNNSTTGATGSTGTMNENPPSSQNPNNTPNSTVPHNNFMADDQAGSQSGTANTNAGTSSQQNSGAAPNATASNPSAEESGRAPGAAASDAGQSSTTGANGKAESSDQVKNDIQTAFKNEPTLTSSNVSVDVSDSKVTLNGSAPSERDRDEARRIAQSFAGNRNVVDNVKVAGMGSSSSSSSSTASTPDASVTPNSNAGSNSDAQSGNSANNPEQPNVPKK